MGKLIISETEKKNILSLYEKTNVAPPPSESVLVVNKNPFKYNEYINARKFYGSSLKDGELFFKKTDGFNKYIQEELSKKIEGKTLRGMWNNRDVVIQINRLFVFTKDDGVVGTQCVHSMQFNGLIDSSEQDSINYFINPGSEITFEQTIFNGITLRSLGDATIKLVNPQSFKSVIFSVSNWNLIPDEYFEIRKIQRQTTDF